MLIQKCMEQQNYKELIRIASSAHTNEDDKIIILNICIAIIGQSIDGNNTVSHESYKDLMLLNIFTTIHYDHEVAFTRDVLYLAYNLLNKLNMTITLKRSKEINLTGDFTDVLKELNIQSEDNPKMSQLMKICANMKCNTEYNKPSALLASLVNILIFNGDNKAALKILKAELPKHYKEFKIAFEKILATNYWSLDIPSLIHKD